MPLIVDEAHGSHFAFDPAFPQVLLTLLHAQPFAHANSHTATAGEGCTQLFVLTVFALTATLPNPDCSCVTIPRAKFAMVHSCMQQRPMGAQKLVLAGGLPSAR